MADSVNMSLDDIIKQNRASRSRGRGGGPGRGRGRGRGRGGGGINRSRSRSRANTPGRQRSRSRGQNGGSQTRGASQSRGRSRSRQRNFNGNRSQSASRSRSIRNPLTPKNRAGLNNQSNIVTRNSSIKRGQRNGLRRSNSQSNLQGVHSRLGLNSVRGRKPLAVAKRGISKRGRGMVTGNRFSSIGLRSDQILQQQRQNLYQENVIRSQIFTRSRRPNRNPSQLTVRVANDFPRRRNSIGHSPGPSYQLNKETIALLNQQLGNNMPRRGPGSVMSLGSNRSNRSGRSNASKRSTSSRGRGRGGIRRGIGRKFKPVLNKKLQKQIAAVQGKTYTGSSDSEMPSGVANFTPSPSATSMTLHQRFANM